MQLYRVAAEDLVGAGSDERAGIVNHLNRQRGVPSATKVVCHDVAKLKDPGIGEQQVHIVSIVTDPNHTRFSGGDDVVKVAHRVPVRAVCLQADDRREGGHSGHNLGVEIDAPFKQGSIVCGPLVDDIEGPDAIQRTPFKITQITTRQVGARRHRVCGIRVVGVIQHPFRIHVPRVVEALHVHNAKVVSPQIIRSAPCRVWTARSPVVHQQHLCSIGTSDPETQIPNETVFNVRRDQLNVIAIFKDLVGVKEVDEQLRRECHAGSIRQISQFRHTNRRQSGPSDALDGVAVEEARRILAKWSGDLGVENRDCGHQHLMRQQVGAVAIVDVLNHQRHDVLSWHSITVAKLVPVGNCRGFHRSITPVPNQ